MNNIKISHVIDHLSLCASSSTIKTLVENVESFDIAKLMIEFRHDRAEFIKCDNLSFDHIALTEESIYLINIDSNNTFTEYRFESNKDLLTLIDDLANEEMICESEFLTELSNVQNKNVVNDNLDLVDYFLSYLEFKEEKILINMLKDCAIKYCETLNYNSEDDHTILQSIVDITLLRNSISQDIKRNNLDKFKALTNSVFDELFHHYMK